MHLLFEEDPGGDERPGEGEGLRQEVEAARGVDQVQLPRPRTRRGLHQAEGGEADEAGVAQEELRGESVWRRRKWINNGGGLYCVLL